MYPTLSTPFGHNKSPQSGSLETSYLMGRCSDHKSLLSDKKNHPSTELNENLTFPDGTGFYPDEQDGQKGYNTSPNRGADTFFPFNNLSNLVNVYSHSGSNYVYTAEKSGYAIYTAFNGSEPTIENISGKAKKIKYDNKSTSHGTEQLYIAYLFAGDKITAKAATGWSLLFG